MLWTLHRLKKQNLRIRLHLLLYPSKHNAICALTLETVVPFDKMQMSWAVFIKEQPPSHPPTREPNPSPRSLTATVGPHSWALNALRAACVGVVPAAVGLSSPADTGRMRPLSVNAGRNQTPSVTPCGFVRRPLYEHEVARSEHFGARTSRLHPNCSTGMDQATIRLTMTSSIAFGAAQ
ncbi:hypothetical protein F2P81_004805 [Scophthalmus maximus]|uniref:Uncharacterized protein n=1 Tax=Scophthalmus maximus TaxID=52904 RepID=A0A6A4TG98_SCOMX|nr:hypothetical protein F2P81_004805 [Scophthalmus maximus]